MKFRNATRLATIALLSLVPEVAGCVQVGTQPMSWSGPIYPQGMTPAPGFGGGSPCSTTLRSCGESLYPPPVISGPSTTDLAPISTEVPRLPRRSTPTTPSTVEPMTPEPLDDEPAEEIQSTQKWKAVRSS